jgi:RNA polymerase sigma factor (TIGR02999 family)
VHECFLRLAQGEQFAFLGRAEFLALASRVLRQALIDHARRQHRDKRGEGWKRITLRGNLEAARTIELELIELEDALAKLGALDERQARIVELRFLGGLTMDEIARLLGAPLESVEGDWTMARAWLKRELSR